ncbi:MAG: 2-C-methyl-D-erythritol 4-phosphate cytidylyltransferase [Gammaproteobacteria bacterium]|nr:2-C-methyl-D-erythritol 4-phosphate cytidylyltransferase [Gammaproteobacteria bacterium]
MAYWAVVPAAGSGTRMSSQVPKQYLALAGKTVIEHTLARLAAHSMIDGIVVALSPNDTNWPNLSLHLAKPVLLAKGGAERCTSVLNALNELKKHARPDDWALVHDGARPCLRPTDVDKLIVELRDHPHGGLLAVPVRDTMKRADENVDVSETVDRKGLWHALTPQMFRLGELSDALRRVIDQGWLVTDEASAMERAGYKPHLVEGAADNIKITRPEDLAVAEFYLRRQEGGG